MGTTDYNTTDDSGNYFGASSNSGAYNALVGNRTIIALAASAVLALAGASASQIANYSGTNYNGSAGACSSSFAISSVADPHIETDFGGQTITKALNSNNIDNLSTVYNTSGGETSLQTAVSNLDERGPLSTFNTESILSGSSWSLDVTPDLGYVDESQGWPYTIRYTHVTVTDANGNTQENLPVSEPDGTQISWNGDNVLVTQPLNGGGALTTNFQEIPYGGNGYLDVSQSANGAAVVSGSAVALAAGSDTAVLALPCSSIDLNNPGANTTTANNADNTPSGNSELGSQGTTPKGAPAPPQPPPPTPLPPALDDSGTAGQASM